MFFHPRRDVLQAAWDPCSYRWIIWSKWEIELCVISIAMVWETMCLHAGTQWFIVCGGVHKPIPEEPQWLVDVLWIPPLPRPPWKTCHWDRIQSSEVESLWFPVMRGWSGELKAADRSIRMRTDNLESDFAICRAPVTESSWMSMSEPWLVSIQ